MITAAQLADLLRKVERHYMIVLHAQIEADNAEAAWKEGLKEWHAQLAKLGLRRTKQGW